MLLKSKMHAQTESAKLRALLALWPTCFVPYILSCFTNLVPYVPLALRASCQTCCRVSHVLCALVPHVFVPRIFSGCLELYVHFCSSSLACCRCFKSDMLLCIWSLAAFMPCVSCAFVTWAIWVFYSLG